MHFPFIRRAALAVLAALAAQPAPAGDGIALRYAEIGGRIGAAGSAAAENPDPLATGRELATEMVESFNDSIRQVFPMTPQMIARYRSIYEAQRRAMLERPEPKARVTAGMATLEPGEESPVVLVAPGVASVIGFYDATGAPWPVNQFVVGDSEGFQVERLGGSGNNLTVSPLRRIGHTNVVVLLSGEDRPAAIRLRISETEAVHRHDVLIGRMGPLAQPNNAARPDAVHEAGSATLLAALSGVDLPEGAVALPVEGVAVRAWLIDGGLYLRSRHTLLAPGWTESLAGPDGMRVYRLEPVSIALFSENGEIRQASIELP